MVKNLIPYFFLVSSTKTVRSPSPDTASDGSSGYTAPTGLPHPKPKHNIRSQLMQAGFELRSSKYILSITSILFLRNTYS